MLIPLPPEDCFTLGEMDIGFNHAQSNGLYVTR